MIRPALAMSAVPVGVAVWVPAEGHWWDVFNPFAVLANGARKVVADGLIALMVGLWNAGLFVLRLVLTIADAFLTPDLSETGPAAAGYRITFWIGGVLVVVLGLVQIGSAVLRRDGRKLGVLAVGFGQYALAWGGSVGYAVMFLAAASGLTRALMQALLGVSSWAQWTPWEAFSVRDVTDGTIAVGLGLLGLFMWMAAFAYLLVLLMRAGALVLLVATGPISAAGLVSDLGSSWFWKSVRWFHAAALTPALMVLTLGLGVQMVTNVPLGYGDDIVKAVGSAFAGVALILVGVVSPVALFKLLAFVDPGTASGAAMRQGLAAVHGVSGLLRGATSGGGASSAASITDAQGRTGGELAARGAATSRLAGSAGAGSGAVVGAGAGGGVGGAGGLAGAAAGVGAAALGLYARGMQVVASAGAAATTVGTDLADQAGLGHNSHYPDYGRWSPTGAASTPAPADDVPPGAAQGAAPGGTPSGTAPGSSDASGPGGGHQPPPGSGAPSPTTTLPAGRAPGAGSSSGPGSSSGSGSGSAAPSQGGGPSFAGRTARTPHTAPPGGGSGAGAPAERAPGIPPPPPAPAPMSPTAAWDPLVAGPTGGEAALRATHIEGETPMSTPAPSVTAAAGAGGGGL